MAGNGALDLSIRIMGKVDPSLVTAIKQTKGLTGDLANALTGTKSLGSTVANTLGVIGKTGLGIMATLTTASAVMIKKTTSMAEEYQAQAADAVKYVGGIMNDDGSIDPEKRATMEDAILKMTTQVPIKRDEMAQIAASLGQSGKSYEQIFLDNQQTGEKSYLYDTARLAAAWDIDAKSAADYMAKWETAFGKTHNQIIDIADSINYLGGHMTTTAAEIASVVNTSGGVGQTAGVDLHTTSALAAAMLAMENILKVFLMAFPEWLACIFMVVGLVVTALAAVRLGYGLVVAKTVYKWIVNAEEKFGSGAGAEKKAHVIAVLRGYTPDWLDWAINERTLDWIVQLVFDFTKKKLEDYMVKKSTETTTVARFGKAGEDKRND